MVAENEDQQLESCERVGKGYSLSKHSLTYLVYSTLLILKIVKSWVSKRQHRMSLLFRHSHVNDQDILPWVSL